MKLKRVAVMAVAPAVWLAMAATPASADASWSRKATYGYAEGTYSADGDTITGYVKDIKADGLCAQIEIRWYDSSGNLRDTDWSAKACPKGEKVWFTKTAGDNPYFDAAKFKILLIAS